MKTFFRLAMIAMVVCAFSSCEELGLTAPAMDSEKALERIRETYEKNIDTSLYKPFQIDWHETDKLSNELTYLGMTMIAKEDNKAYSQRFKVGGDYKQAYEIKEDSYYRSEKFDFDTVDWIELSDINSEMILKQIEEAKSYIPDEYAFKSVGQYKLEKDKETKELVSKFTIRVVERGNSKSLEGGSVVTTYYELSFKGLSDGTVIYEEE